MSHWLTQAINKGLRERDLPSLLPEIARHISLEGEWEGGVISPSLVATQCPLARLKKFLGHGPQPGRKWMASRAGRPDPITNMNFTRGFVLEGMLVTVLKDQLEVLGHAPGLVFRYVEPASFPLPQIVYAGHPDLMIKDGRRIALIQIKAPSVFKLDRVEARGKQDIVNTYLPQCATEMYIGRKMGLPIDLSYLLLATWEATPKMNEVRVLVLEIEWEDAFYTIPEQVARDLHRDLDLMRTGGGWPSPYPEHQADVFPCSYCSYARISEYGLDGGLIGCTENQEWERYEETGQTRLSVIQDQVETIPSNEKVKLLKRRKTG